MKTHGSSAMAGKGHEKHASAGSLRRARWRLECWVQSLFWGGKFNHWYDLVRFDLTKLISTKIMRRIALTIDHVWIMNNKQYGRESHEILDCRDMQSTSSFGLFCASPEFTINEGATGLGPGMCCGMWRNQWNSQHRLWLWMTMVSCISYPHQ